MPTKTPRVAIIHDWLLTHRGGEKVLEAIGELFPAATIFTMFHRRGKTSAAIEKHPIVASCLNAIPGAHRFYRHLLPLMPLAVERFDLSHFDLIISSSHCVAKGIIPPPSATHVSYCHTPMRYIWDRFRDYFPVGPKEWLVLPFVHRLRQWDVTSSARVDHFIANSHWVGRRIEKYYRRSSDVVYPFVDLSAFAQVGAPPDTRSYYLVVSGFAPYKRIDLAIQACQKLGVSLRIVGDGQAARALKKLSGENVKFLGKQTTAQLRETYRGARALLFPGEEDFGIVPLEAMACGTPVIAFNRGGATETVIHQKTGWLFDEQSVEGLSTAIQQFERATFQESDCTARAGEFTKERFKRDFLAVLEKLK